MLSSSQYLAQTDVSISFSKEIEPRKVPTEVNKVEPSVGEKRERENSGEPDEYQGEQSIVRDLIWFHRSPTDESFRLLWEALLKRLPTLGSLIPKAARIPTLCISGIYNGYVLMQY